MEPQEAWRVISANLSHYYRMTRNNTFKGYTQTDIEAEVVTFQALKELQLRLDGERREGE